MSHNTVADVKLEQVIGALHILLSPDLDKGSQSDKVTGTRDTVLQKLQRNIQNLEIHLSESNQQPLQVLLSEETVIHRHFKASQSVEWVFVFKVLELLRVACLLLLHLQKKAAQITPESSEEVRSKVRGPDHPKYAPPLAKTTLSIQQTNTIRSALQFVTFLGMCPHFLAGVGIPVQLRSKATILFSTTPDDVNCREESMESKRAKLWLCTSTLITMLEVPELRGLIMVAHLNDVLAALLQLSFGYSEVESTDTQPSGIESEGSSEDHCMCPVSAFSYEEKNKVDRCFDGQTSGLQTSVKDELRQDRCITWNVSKCREALEKVLATANPDQVVRELLVIQNGIPQNLKDLPGAPNQPPAWLKRACVKYLVKILSGPKGIQHLYAAMMAGVDPSSPSHWQHCQTLARLAARLPLPRQQVEQYVHSISQQLFDILHANEGASKLQVSQLIGSIVNEMMLVHRKHIELFFLRPLLGPLYKCLDDSAVEGKDHVIVREEELSTCLEDMQKVYVNGQQPQASILSTLQPVMGALWALFCFTQDGVSSVRRIVRELIIKFLKNLSCDQAAVLLQHFSISHTVGATEGNFPSVALSVIFVHGSHGGIKAVRTNGERILKLGEDSQINAVIDILKDMKTDGVAGELLVSLLKELTEIVSRETQQAGMVLPARVERLEVKVEKEKELRKKVTLLHLLASICETFGSECLVKPSQILLFVKASLERAVTICQGISEQEMAIFESETMSMALGLLTAILAGAVLIGETERNLLDEMMPQLSIIGQGHPDESIREMAGDLRIAIATRGAVWPTLEEKKQKEQQISKHQLVMEDSVKLTTKMQHPTSFTKTLIEELPDPPSAIPAVDSFQAASHKPSSVQNSNTVSGQSAKSKLAEAFEQLCDPLLPVRGHALITLTKLVEARDPETLSKKDVVQKIFYENMQHGDSYLYLTAINGMSALADRFSESVVPVLAAEFAGFNRQKSNPSAGQNMLTSEHRLKLGEALMKATRNLGELVPKYREVLLAAVMTGTHDEDPIVKASSLSNLAELCRLLRFSLGPVLHEVFNCCSCFLVNEQDLVRRAACMTLAKILEGLDKDALTVLDCILKDLYRLLKKLHERDPDETVRLHANMALVQLDTMARNFLFPKQTLQKKIQVLSNEDTYR